MQILFTQTEIRDALIEALEKQIILAPGQTTSIEFDLDDPNDIVAYVDVIREGQKAQGIPPKAEPAKLVTNTPRAGETEAQTTQRRTRGPNKPKPSAEPVIEADPVNEPKGASDSNPIMDANVAMDPDTLTEGQAEEDTQADAPFVDPEDVKSQVQKIEQTKTSGSVGIFPSATSSAPVKEVVPTPAVGAKSLFANLQKPVNDSSKMN